MTILMLAPAPNMTFAGAPSGATYVADRNSVIAISSNSAADQVALQADGCYTLQPLGGTLSSDQALALYAVMAAAGAFSGLGSLSLALFTGLSAFTPPAAATAILVGGYSTEGIGPGTYVADGLANAGLAASCPRFCGADSTGRYWRLEPQGGAIAISQGGALGGTHNDQPAVQAAIDYAKAIAARTVILDFDTVSIWNTTRTSNASQNATDAWAQDGQSIWVTAPIKLLGVGSGTRLKMLSTTGSSLETGWQNVGGNVWRGSGINLIGGSSGTPNANGLTAFEMENVWLDGGCAYTGVRTAVTPSSPDGPDLTNKGIRLQNTQCDKIILTNCIISGFKGEAAYHAGTTQTLQILKNTRIFGSNQSAFNPSTGIVQADNCEFGSSFISAECLGGIGGRYTNCRFYDFIQTGVTGGPANGLLYNYAYATRDGTKAPPWIDLIDCDFHNAGQLIVGNYLRIVRGRATDIFVTLNTAITNGALTSTYIDMDVTLDQTTGTTICTIAGPPTLTTLIPGAPAGTYIQPVSDVHIRLNIHRTAQAKAANAFAFAYAVTGCVDQDSCSLHLGEADGAAQMVNPDTSSGMPLLTMDGPTSSQTYGAGRPWGVAPLTVTAGPYAATINNPRHSLVYSGSAATIAVTIAAPFTGSANYANGQRCRIWWDSYTAAGTIFTFAKDGTGLRLTADRKLFQFGDWLELEFSTSTGLWHEVGYHAHLARLTGSKTWAPGTIATGASVSTTLTVTGAVMLTDAIDVLAFNGDQKGCALSEYFSADNTITAVMTNNTGSSQTIASATLRGEVTK